MIYCHNIWFHQYFNQIHKKGGIVLSYIKKVKFRHVIKLTTTCGYKNCDEQRGFNVRYTFAKYYFALPVLHNILNHFFAWTFYHFTCLRKMKGDIVWMTNYDYDKYFSISARGKSDGLCDEKFKEKYNYTTKENDIDE